MSALHVSDYREIDNNYLLNGKGKCIVLEDGREDLLEGIFLNNKLHGENCRATIDVKQNPIVLEGRFENGCFVDIKIEANNTAEVELTTAEIALNAGIEDIPEDYLEGLIQKCLETPWNPEEGLGNEVKKIYISNTQKIIFESTSYPGVIFK